MRNRVTKIAATVGRVVAYGLLAFTVIVAVGSVIIPRVTGGAALTVLSGSMTPRLPVGSLAFVRPVDPESVEVGNIITAEREPGKGGYVTHRVVEVNDTDPLSFTTKGDTNEADDSEPVPAGAVRGKLWFDVPKLGSFRDWIGSRLGLITIAALIALVQLGPKAAQRWNQRRRSDAGDETPSGAVATPVVPTVEASIEREMMLFTVVAPPGEREEIAQLIMLMGGEVVDMSHAALTATVEGHPSSLDDVERLLEPWPPVVLRRSGVLAVPKLDPAAPRPEVRDVGAAF